VPRPSGKVTERVDETGPKKELPAMYPLGISTRLSRKKEKQKRIRRILPVVKKSRAKKSREGGPVAYQRINRQGGKRRWELEEKKGQTPRTSQKGKKMRHTTHEKD